LDDFRFVRECKTKLTNREKDELVNKITIKKVKAGQRIFPETQDKIDTFHMILAGKTGIFYQD